MLPMKIRHGCHSLRIAAGVLLAAGLFASIASLEAQTVFSTPSTFVNYETGSVVSALGHGGVFPVTLSTIYSDPGTVTNNITPVTFGRSFTVETSGTSAAGTGAFGYQGNITGASIGAGTTIPISYNFTLGNNGAITSTVDWVLFFRGGSNTEVQIASGTMAAPTPGVASSQIFSGNAMDYMFTSGATAGSDTYRAYIGLSFTNNLGAMMQGILTVSMADTGFQGPGITINASAIPEPSTYAAIAAGAALALACWQRRRRLAGAVAA